MVLPQQMLSHDQLRSYSMRNIRSYHSVEVKSPIRARMTLGYHPSSLEARKDIFY
jgi:hypothetical protein